MFDSCWGQFFSIMDTEQKEMKARVKKRHFDRGLWLWIVTLVLFFPLGSVTGEETGNAKAETAPKEATSQITPEQLNAMKAEWEEVREQQIQMIREKEEQLEKLKEDIFLKMKAMNAPAAVPAAVAQPALAATPVSVATPVPENSAELETQKAALRAERQKFFSEMARQRESLLKLQASLDAKGKQLEAERQKFELEKKKSVS